MTGSIYKAVDAYERELEQEERAAMLEPIFCFSLSGDTNFLVDPETGESLYCYVQVVLHRRALDKKEKYKEMHHRLRMQLAKKLRTEPYLIGCISPEEYAEGVRAVTQQKELVEYE